LYLAQFAGGWQKRWSSRAYNLPATDLTAS
jgi:hypothetical protein